MPVGLRKVSKLVSRSFLLKPNFAFSAKRSLTMKPPHRKSDGTLTAPDWPESFQPNLTPKEVIQAGSFGGTYFRDIKSRVTKKHHKDTWKELPKDWIDGIDVEKCLASQEYRVSVNKYGVNCGVKADKSDTCGLDYWEQKGWIVPQDPYGWFQWYCRFYQGRRSDDDARQISRWAKCAGVKGRWRNNLIGKIHAKQTSFDDVEVSPVVRQVLLHWAYELTEKDYEKGVSRRIANAKEVVSKDTNRKRKRGKTDDGVVKKEAKKENEKEDVKVEDDES